MSLKDMIIHEHMGSSPDLDVYCSGECSHPCSAVVEPIVHLCLTQDGARTAEYRVNVTTAHPWIFDVVLTTPQGDRDYTIYLEPGFHFIYGAFITYFDLRARPLSICPYTDTSVYGTLDDLDGVYCRSQLITSSDLREFVAEQLEVHSKFGSAPPFESQYAKLRTLSSADIDAYIAGREWVIPDLSYAEDYLWW
jgi:hypothetical protein